MLSGCFPEQLLGQNRTITECLWEWQTPSVRHKWKQMWDECETWMLTCEGGSYWRGCWRWSHLLLTTFLWDKIRYKPHGSRRSICCWLGASQTKKRSFAILVTAQNVHFHFARKLLLIKCRLLCWLFSCSLFTYLATFACSKGYWAWTRMFPCYSSVSWISSHLSRAANPVLVV